MRPNPRWRRLAERWQGEKGGPLASYAEYGTVHRGLSSELYACLDKARTMHGSDLGENEIQHLEEFAEHAEIAESKLPPEEE